jgi:EAL domain-containing protein (putative c-di-GMP-specific phosphodiesterase class I)/ActR/RegA family two-component response regulator
MTPTRSILVIDDDDDICELISATAESMGLRCTTTTEAAAFLDALTPDTALIMLDLLMPETDGIELLRVLGQQQCKVGIILVSGTGKRIIEIAQELAQAHGLSVVGHLEKPFELEDLETVLKTNTQPTAVLVSRPGAKPVFEDAELYTAVECNQFILHYQPQIDIPTGDVVGLEALVRWQHPEHGLIFPNDFIPRLEKLGLIDQLGWIVAGCALSEMSKFADKNGVMPILSLNISVSSLYDLKVPDTLAALIATHGVSPQKVMLEITESGLIKELTHTLDVLIRLRLKKIQLSIDDFGAGYSTMQQLQNIPATELKIDRSFVQNMHGRDSDRIMVQKMIEIGHELGMKVVAEGVETSEQLAFLRSTGCDFAQGYLYSRPLPVPELLVWLESYRARHSIL